MFTELFLAWRYLFRGSRRHISFISAVSCAGIGLGVGTLIVVISVMNGFDRDLTEKLMKFNYHIVVEAQDNSMLGDLEEEIESWEVASATRFLQTQIFAKFDNLILPLVVKGMDFSDTKEHAIFSQYITEDSGSPGFYAGEGLRRRFFSSREFDFYPLEKELKLKKGTLRGFFQVGLYDIDTNYLITDIPEAEKLSPNYLMFLGVRLADPYQAPAFKQKLLEAFPDEVFATTWIESNQVLFSALQLEKFTMFIILSLIILVAAFNIFATLTVRVVEKTKDVGILKSLGFTRRRILGIFSLQGLMLGGLGTIVGANIGLGLCWLLEKYHFIRLPEEIYYIEYLPVAINYADIALILGVGFAMSYIFSLFPAIRAANLSPNEALRYE